ncbi:MAG TPA: hypothetical protein VFA98_06530 [Thermoanaerobaculia bacterium]|jgi:hypothetical protein|nr:hypothetical protein [Thermoanaerobaculia bacterium]
MTNDARGDVSKIHTYVIASYPNGEVRKTMPCGRSGAYVEAAHKELGRNEELYVTWEGKRFRVTRP